MPHPVAAPSEADALRRLAEAMKRVHLPAAWVQVLLALLAVLTGNTSILAPLGMDRASLSPLHGRTWRTPRRDWQFSPTGETIDDLAPVLPPRALRRLRRQRAWIGWILRGLPGRGMRRAARRAPAPGPRGIARAPPHAAVRPVSPRIRRENPAARGEDSCPQARGMFFYFRKRRPFLLRQNVDNPP